MAKARDFGVFTRWALLLAGLFVICSIGWDYTIDPVNAWRAVGWRLTEAAAMVAWALVSWHDLRAPIARAAAVSVPLLVSALTIQILSQLEHGASYGLGAFLYFYIFGPFLVLAQPFVFAVAILALLTLTPMLVAPFGFSAGLDWGVYNVYVWMAFVPVVGLLLLFEYLYLSVFSYRQLIETQAATDGLTRIANRRHFLGESRNCLVLHHNERREASVLFIDIDRFKAVNDSYGHRVGDAAIQYIVHTLMPVLRTDDLLARYGGEEFVVLLHDTGYAPALKIAERIRAIVAAETFWPGVDGATAMHLTVSIGVATYRPVAENTPDIDQLVLNADQALYEAKRRGRDCVVGEASVRPTAEIENPGNLENLTL